MDDGKRVLERLERIERLRATAPAATLLDELRLLLPEAEAWARAEGDARASEAVRQTAEKLRGGAEGMR